MPYTTRTRKANTLEQRGDRWRVVVTHTGSAVPALDWEYHFSTDEDLARQSKAYEAVLNGAAPAGSGVVADPTVAADPAGAMRAAIEDVRKVAELEALRAALVQRAFVAGGGVSANEANGWAQLATDLAARIDAIKELRGGQYFAADAPTRAQGINNL